MADELTPEQINDEIRQQQQHHADEIRERRGEAPRDRGAPQRDTGSKEAQHGHAQTIRDQRAERGWAAKNPEEAAVRKALIDLARDEKAPGAVTKTAAEQHTFAAPGAAPKSAPAPPPNQPAPGPGGARDSASAGSVTFVACVDDGMGGFTPMRITAPGTTSAYP